MEEANVQDKIHILTEYSQKVQWEEKLRYLWKNCFGDPQHYEDFYFDMVYANNKVYAIEGKGMIHLNFYPCRVMGRDMLLPYIVGVATDERYRRQGVMRVLLEQVLSDLFEQKIPFTYLMPANEEYYKPFGFQCIRTRSESEIICEGKVSLRNFQYVSYDSLCNMSSEFQLRIFSVVNQWLEKRYDVFAIHDEAYYRLLQAEKACQSGNVVFCFDDAVDEKHLCGVFAYAMDENIPYVEQIIIEDRLLPLSEGMNTLLCSYFADYDKIKVANSYPYMLRVVHQKTFLELFRDQLSKPSDGQSEELTDEQIIKMLKEKNSIYFAEIV